MHEQAFEGYLKHRKKRQDKEELDRDQRRSQEQGEEALQAAQKVLTEKKYADAKKHASDAVRHLEACQRKSKVSDKVVRDMIDRANGVIREAEEGEKWYACVGYITQRAPCVPDLVPTEWMLVIQAMVVIGIQKYYDGIGVPSIAVAAVAAVFNAVVAALAFALRSFTAKPAVRYDAVGRIAVEDGLVRMAAPVPSWKFFVSQIRMEAVAIMVVSVVIFFVACVLEMVMAFTTVAFGVQGAEVQGRTMLSACVLGYMMYILMGILMCWYNWHIQLAPSGDVFTVLIPAKLNQKKEHVGAKRAGAVNACLLFKILSILLLFVCSVELFGYSKLNAAALSDKQQLEKCRTDVMKKQDQLSRLNSKYQILSEHIEKEKGRWCLA